MPSLSDPNGSQTYGRGGIDRGLAPLPFGSAALRAASPPSLLFSREKTEEEGFEPPVPCGTSVFKTDAFGHSATLPEKNINFLAFLPAYSTTLTG